MLALLNDCLRARKCNLVPYDTNDLGSPFYKDPSVQLKKSEESANKKLSKVESAAKGGCCHGQTGHHLVPGASLEESCPNYDHGAAPTVCVEGTSQHRGSHGRAHIALADEHEALARKKKVKPDGSMSMGDALDAAAKSHQKAFPLSNCSQKCIRAQLESYYRTCHTSRPKMVNKDAIAILPPPQKSDPPKTNRTTL